MDFQTSYMLPEDEDAVSNDVPGSVNKKLKFQSYKFIKWDRYF